MGSYLSVVNDTPDTWQCKVGPDEAALKIFTVILSALGAAVGAAGASDALAGAGGPLATAISSSGIVNVFGVAFDALKAIPGAAQPINTAVTIAGPVSQFALTIANNINQQIQKKAYVTIAPGQKHRWGKMSLSLWQQSVCTKTVIIDAETVRTETVYMRPIFSGSTANSNRDHSIQWWINKDGTEAKTVKGNTNGPTRALEEGGDVEGEHFLIYPDGTIVDADNNKIVEVNTIGN
ncbi:hypothetical protein P43SY_007619 [Pythium insidiosum]|uniref:Uncharacterized protein n=1 Tax=Pythium insidiosum TaxID=114742 RepID=A0AAD5LHL3_PYTIN|nr:hypothetical protein P43SY_007619 [Pythium insidiosum]KAJ0403658.1 hypothetical protein ATCC90586_005594 [Pythium insidiosum]